MENLEIKTANAYNNGASSSLSINLSNGKTMCANLLMSDLKKYIKKEVSEIELAYKYFHKDNGSFIYSNPCQ